MAIADELALLKSTKASIKEKLTNKDLQPTAEEISQIEAMGYTLA